MTDLRTAAQQALEALKDFACHGSAEGLWDVVYDLRAALEQPEHKVTLKPVFYAPRKLSNEEVMAVIGPFRREQPEQDVPEKDCGNMEPVARVLQTVGQYHTGRCVAEVETVRRLRNGESLYTHPPRREWRGLTDTERAAVQHESFKRGLSPLEFMELHEAKLKEKNHE
jgi:hypothetical protein